MTTTLQRASDAATALFWAAPGGPFPINAQLVVGPDECVVAHLDGAVLGVIPPGNHWLNPQPFPFLGPTVVGGASLRAELWFVRTSRVAGIPLGGRLGTVVDPKTGVECSPRGFGECSLLVTDPALLVGTLLGQSATDPAAFLTWASSAVMARVSSAFTSLVGTGQMGVADAMLIARLSQALDGPIEALQASGVKLGGLGSFSVVLSAEEQEAVKRAMKDKAAAAQAAKKACGRCGVPNDAGGFCTACGARLGA